jgi:hypothetical protein
VVETGGLENRLALTGYGGSNPSPSAIKLFRTFREILEVKDSSAKAGLLCFYVPIRATEIQMAHEQQHNPQRVEEHGL